MGVMLPRQEFRGEFWLNEEGAVEEMSEMVHVQGPIMILTV